MWINPENKQVFWAHAEIRAAFSNVSFPAVMSDTDIASVGLVPVNPTPQPVFDRLTETAVEVAPVKTDGVWTQQWQIILLTADEQDAVAAAVRQEVTAATQKRLDAFAQTRNYDGIMSACTYATSTVPKFQAEGQYAVTARDATWAKLYQILTEVEAGTRPVPSGFADVEPDLPVLVWPE